MTRKAFIYTTDKNREYLVYLDSSIGSISALGFSAASEQNIKDLDLLPRKMKMRNFGCAKKDGGVYGAGSELIAPSRVFAVGSKEASVLANHAGFSYKGSVYVPRRYHPEKRR